MNSSNKKLKKYAEALNDAAPKGEFLAFINPQESELLRRNGALGLLTDFGIPSYRNAYGGGGQYSGGGGNTGNGGGEGNRMSYATGGQYGSGKSTEGEGNAAGQRAKELEAARVREQARIQSQIDAQKKAEEKKAADEKAARAREEARIQSQIKSQKPAPSPGDTGGEGGFDPQDESDTQFGETSAGRDPRKQFEDIAELTEDQIKALEEQRQQAQYAISPSTDPKNQTIRTLLNLGIFPGVGNLYSAYLDATALGYPLSASFPDLSGFFGGGDISQQMENIQSIQGGNGDDGGGGMGQVSTPVAPVAPSNNLPPSMVNQYFANLNLGQALSSDLQTNYNNAKNNVNSLLGINPMSQQFGYSADPYGGLMASNLTTNPYNIDYLRRLGLI